MVVWWSLQNAYNLGMQISVTYIAGGTQPTGTTCTSPSCTISDLSSFCQSPNTLTGAPGEGCYNTDGPGNVATAGTQAFASACPQAYSYSKNDAPHVYGCPTTSNYQVTWCPWLRDQKIQFSMSLSLATLRGNLGSSFMLVSSKRWRLNIYLYHLWKLACKPSTCSLFV